MKRINFLEWRRTLEYDRVKQQRFASKGLIRQYADGTITIHHPGRETLLEYPEFKIKILRSSDLPDNLSFFLPGQPNKKIPKTVLAAAMGAHGAVYDVDARALYAYPKRHGPLIYKMDTQHPYNPELFSVYLADRKHAREIDEKVEFTKGIIRVRARLDPEFKLTKPDPTKLNFIFREHSVDELLELFESNPSLLKDAAVLAPDEKYDGDLLPYSAKSSAVHLLDKLRRVPASLPYIGVRDA